VCAAPVSLLPFPSLFPCDCDECDECDEDECGCDEERAVRAAGEFCLVERPIGGDADAEAARGECVDEHLAGRLSQYVTIKRGRKEHEAKGKDDKMRERR
jgi:hypothetical protein